MACNRLARGVLVLLVASGVVASKAEAADGKDVVGTWKLKYEPGDGQTHEPVVKITKEGADLKVEFVEAEQKWPAKDVRYKDGQLSFKVESKHNDGPVSVTYKGKPSGDSLKGEAEWEYGGMSGTFNFEGKREDSKPKD